MQVLGTLLPPVAPPADTGSASRAPSGAPAAQHGPERPAGDRRSWRSRPSKPRSSTSRRFAIGRDHRSILRSPDDFIDPVTAPADPAGLDRDDRHHPQDPGRLVRRPAAGHRPARPPDRRPRSRRHAVRTLRRPDDPRPARRARSDRGSRARRSPITPTHRIAAPQGPTRARWPTRSASSSSTTSPRPAIT